MQRSGGGYEESCFSTDLPVCNCPCSVGLHLGGDQRLDVAVNERGFVEVQILMMYLVFALTMLAFLLGLFYGTWKQASAKYMWFAESLDFAAQAANKTGNVWEVRLNQEKAKRYFEAAMEQTVGSYVLNSFYTVDRGDPVPGGGTAQSPGYVAAITVPVFEGNVPLIGVQRVEIPMRYYAVVKSKQIK